MYEKQIAELLKQLEDEKAHSGSVEEQLNAMKKLLSDHEKSMQKALADTNQMCEERIAHLIQIQNSEIARFEGVEEALDKMKKLSKDHQNSNQEKQRKGVEADLLTFVPKNGDHYEDKKSHMKENRAKPLGLHKLYPSRETILVGLEKFLQLFTSGDIDVQIRAVKVVANLAAEDLNQEKIVEEGGLDALLMLLQSCQNIAVLRAASGAIANLAMNEMNQCLIMNKGGVRLLASTASKTDDPQALRMVAGAIANLCGNEKFHLMLRDDGAIKALRGMARSGNSDVIAQVARGIANFAKCESREIIQGHRRGRSVLIEDDVLSWLIVSSTTVSASSQRHFELALCHLAQNEDNARDFISSGGVKAIARISVESSREDIRNLAKKTLKLSPAFKAEMNTERLCKLYTTEL
ncbi:hypothetical protein Vadar_024976 [Vaccinium darrowii]|uniref:Uncharacterized protein n=1 Tax=Vaccinium darrowii TaxID=229202 RepID=A0ACB7YQM9_9ERIC|nr:hypothetical protein Vadar_024976 [Vaccinium darrowii]